MPYNGIDAACCPPGDVGTLVSSPLMPYGIRRCLAAPVRIRRMARDGTWLSVHASPLHQCIDRRMDNDTKSPAISQ
jgi:hypothetical protein